MELTKIVIENYRSIQSPVTISFAQNMPTVLIGKNGCGKTTILEVLFRIAEANRKGSYGHEKGDILYNARIQLSEEDLKAVLPILKYDKEKCEIVAYGGNEYLQMDRIESPYIVPSFKKEIADIGELADQLEQAVAVYQRQIEKITREDGNESPIQSFEWQYADGHLTDYHRIHSDAKYFLEDIRKFLDALHDGFTDRENQYIFQGTSHVNSYFLHHEPKAFHLKYVEPALSAFVQKHIIIDRDAIQKEIDRINTETRESCDLINTLIDEIRERTIRILDGFRRADDRFCDDREEKDARYSQLLIRVKEVIGRKCLFLRNENNDGMFQSQRRDIYSYQDHSDTIIKTYLRHVYEGEDKESLLSASKKDLILSEQALADFEAYLNDNLPAFDKGMYRGISVESDQQGKLSIFLNENTGERIELNETSAGRRWYFTYYFMKNLLDEGDIFIIDEPAATLHPLAQREVMAELTELVRRGIKVVYSTHSPYLIPKEWQSVHCVTMTEEGTKVNGSLSNRELTEQMKEIVGTDIFDLSDLISKYETCDVDQITKNAYKLVIATQKERGIKNQQDACEEITISLDTLKSWNRLPRDKNGKENKKYSRISLENLIKVLRWARKTFEEVLD